MSEDNKKPYIKKKLVSRRDFLVAGGAVIAAGALSACKSQTSTETVTNMVTNTKTVTNTTTQSAATQTTTVMGAPVTTTKKFATTITTTAPATTVTKTVPPDKVTLEVLNPIALMQVEKIIPVDRPADLNNKKIVLYSNGKVNSNFAVDEVMIQLKKRFPSSTYAYVAGTSWAPETGFYDAILNNNPDIVISSTGD